MADPKHGNRCGGSDATTVCGKLVNFTRTFHPLKDTQKSIQRHTARALENQFTK